MLIRSLYDEYAVAEHATRRSRELIADGYAHLLELDVVGLRLKREIARLAESGDPRVAGELRALSVLLRRVTRTNEKLHDLLNTVRARCERRR